MSIGSIKKTEVSDTIIETRTRRSRGGSSSSSSNSVQNTQTTPVADTPSDTTTDTPTDTDNDNTGSTDNGITLIGVPAKTDNSQTIAPVQPTPEPTPDISTLSDTEFNKLGDIGNYATYGMLSMEGAVELYNMFDEVTILEEVSEKLLDEDEPVRVIISMKDDVPYIELDKPVKIATSASFPQIGQPNVEGTTVNSVTMDGTGQTVCVIDTGVDYNHAEFGSCTGTQFLNGNCPKVIGGWDFFNNNADADDGNAHGTAVAGLIAANGSTYKGMAPGAKIVALRVTAADGTGWSSLVDKAINWCVNNASTYGITAISIGVATTNTYSGTACDGGVVDTAASAAISAGIPVYAPSGNSGSTTGISFPACVSAITGVGPVRDGSSGGSADDIWTTGNRDSILDLLAPGESIVTLNVPTGTANAAGTSFSMAHAVGADILLRQYHSQAYSNSLTPAQMETLMKNTGTSIYDAGTSQSYPRIDVYDAAHHETTAPTVTITAPANNFKNLTDVTISYTVTDFHPITKCELYVDSSLSQNDTSITRSVTQSFSITGLSQGPHTVQVQCEDTATTPNTGNSAQNTYNVNYIPSISTIPTQVISEDAITVHVDLSSYFTDQDTGDTLTMSIVTENTAQVDCGVNGVGQTITLLPNTNWFGSASCTIDVSDGLQTSNQIVVSITVNSVNDVPTISSTPVTSTNVGASYQYSVIANDIELDTLTYSLTTKPNGMSISSTTGVISWTVAQGYQGNQNVIVKVDDGNGGIITQPYTLNVANAVPVITSSPGTTASINSLYTYSTAA
ncbi:S8 family serine peptidase, partial [Nanoarchaeota archaeon]